jgi:hypothetical protein
MPIHSCLDPQDPYAEREVRVAFAWGVAGPRLIAVLDEQGANILPDLIEAQRDDLLREIADAAPACAATPGRTAGGAMAWETSTQ